MISSETVPFAKSGGLADVIGALSKKIASQGYDVRIVIPRYSSISPEHLHLVRDKINVPIDFGYSQIRVLQARIPDSEVPVYFIDHPDFSARPGFYGGHGSHTYRDNHRRFALFNRAVFALCREIEWIPDILHGHDWQTGLVGAYLREWEQQSGFQNSKNVFSIHNIGYQGIFSKHDLHSTQLSWETCNSDTAGYDSRLNFLKCGILNADALTTVSPTYAREIQSPEFGHGLEEILSERGAGLVGILNGVDYEEWDPRIDPHIPVPFSPEDLSGKREAKRALQEKAGLPVRSDLPVIGMVSRLAAQKGFYELCDPHRGALKRICNEMAVQVVILGTGEKWIEEELIRLQTHSSNLKFFSTFSNTMAHLIEAGSDLFLMPSRYEPCGLNQIYSLRYATLPIVRRTGGLADTVENYDPQTGDGTGFMFDELSPEEIFHGTERAVSTWYERPEHFQKMQHRAMGKHFSWDDSARKYLELYRMVLEQDEKLELRS